MLMLLLLARRGAGLVAPTTRRGITTARPAAAYDVIVIGGGHAGCEAATAAARAGARTALVTQNADTVGEMSCNPSIGGIGKGHLVKEVDALGGVMGRGIDWAGIHFRMLNRRKGPAVWGPRAQADRDLYKDWMQNELSDYPNLSIVEASAEDVLFDNEEVRAVQTSAGELETKAAVITTGTFLRGKIFVGSESFPAGRYVRDDPYTATTEPPSCGLAKTLEVDLALPLSRLKTGTPPRLDGRTIDWDKCVEQPSEEAQPFSYFNDQRKDRKTVKCFRTATNQKTHDIVRDYVHTLAPTTTDGVGPRYCPSLHKKVERFSERDSHVVWLEPEGLETDLVYPNGLSGAWPRDVQEKIVRSIVGLERAEIVQPGYDVEYDFVDPRSLDHGLGVRNVVGLHLAGQICGTTGYEEAAALGIVAGANAALSALDRDLPLENRRRFVVGRDQGYIGVLVDDLVTRGTMEPYRMFTSRAEYRLHLRADNADLRLTEKGAEVGLVESGRLDKCLERSKLVDDGVQHLDSLRFAPEAWGAFFLEGAEAERDAKRRPHKTASELLAMPHADFDKLKAFCAEQNVDLNVAADAEDTVAAQCKYAAYLTRQKRDMDNYRKHDATKIPADLDYSEANLPALSAEEREKLVAARPRTFAEAGAISGLTPASLVYLYQHVSSRGK
mmetsp:Transcript_5435/g.15237  ORF Transcript_5435/g.15237 Transcript_5435/m.15237 type:complete len:670 (-) Transcript_5435:11-2020(-)